METRIGTWILGTGGLNLTLLTWEDRPADDKAKFQGGPIWRIKDVFSSYAGSWEVKPGQKYGMDEWARTDYWQGAKWSSAGDHNFHVMVLDQQGNPMPGKGILFRQNDWNWQPGDVRQAQPKGDADVVLANSYGPARGEHGSWKGCAYGRSDVVVGVDMPLNEHVTVYAVFQAVDDTVDPVDPTDPDLAGVITAINGLTAQVKRLADHLGAP